MIRHPIARFVSGLLLTLAAPVALSGQTTTSGFAPERLARIDRFMQQYVDSNRIAGAVGFVLRDGKVVYEHSVGWRDREAASRMTSDAMFRMASESKLLTSVAAMMLVEEGRLALGDAVSRYIPGFAHTTVALRADTGRAPVPAKRQITVKDLLTHTAGISYGTDAFVARQYSAKQLGPAAGFGWYTADKDEPICTTMERLATLPFVLPQPGESWVYGYGSDVMGCVIERASGMPLDEFIRTRITAPLGMRDTYFFVPKEKAARLVAVYTTDSTGHATRAADDARGQGHYVNGPRRNFSGGAGVVSTARDYSRFLSMLLNRGTLDGVRYLSPKTVDLMTSDQTNGLYGTNGLGFGLGVQVVQRLGADGLASVGSYSWRGAYSTIYKVDPAERLIVLFMMNQFPLNSDVEMRFPTLVYQALVDSRVGTTPVRQ